MAILGPLCIFLSSLTSHLQDATGVTHLGRQAVSCMENSQKWRRKRSHRTEEESQPPPHPQSPACPQATPSWGLLIFKVWGWSKNNKHARWEWAPWLGMKLWFYCADRSLSIAQRRTWGLAQHCQPRNNAVSTKTDKCTPALTCCGHGVSYDHR